MNLKDFIRYDPETGEWVWLVTRNSRAISGLRAGTKSRSGYFVITLGAKHYLSHRLAWFYMTGQWPKDQIDHINGQRDDNRWVNLREATNTQNQANSLRQKNNSSGMKGVTWQESRQKWRARIQLQGKSIHLGRFNTKEEAHTAYVGAARAYFGEFANPG